jgi:hypothetical protein
LSGQFGADDRRIGVNLRANMAGDQTDDPFGLRRFQPRTGIDAALTQPVEP